MTEQGQLMNEHAPPLRQTSRMVVTDPSAAVETLLKENQVLGDALAELQARMPSDADLEFLHRLRIERERTTWAWATLRRWVAWGVPICSALGAALYHVVKWLADNFQFRPHP